MSAAQDAPEDAMPSKKVNVVFGAFAEKAALWAGSSVAFVLAIAFIVAWMLSGPFFHYSPHWEMLISTVPTVVTFLLVFLIQNSQTREILAVQLKLNELIRATDGAHTVMLSLEKLTEEELVVLCGQYELLAEEARKRLKRGETDKGVPEIPDLPVKASA
ncbi:MAG: low affinity iron permease family protein [Pseudomonadota bacterium]|nr:low affinity iron permease family protein [Pseudomonadota bacterium]